MLQRQFAEEEEEEEGDEEEEVAREDDDEDDEDDDDDDDEEDRIDGADGEHADGWDDQVVPAAASASALPPLQASSDGPPARSADEGAQAAGTPMDIDAPPHGDTAPPPLAEAAAADGAAGGTAAADTPRGGDGIVPMSDGQPEEEAVGTGDGAPAHEGGGVDAKVEQCRRRRRRSSSSMSSRLRARAAAPVGGGGSSEPPAESDSVYLRDRNSKRPGGTSIPVGVEVAILRSGPLKGKVGTVSMARSGYYQVKLTDGGEGSEAVFFRGKELWMTADGEPPAELPLAAPPSRRGGVMGASAVHELLGSRGGGGGRDGDGGGDAPKWWWQSWGHVDGVRKRKPTQLYDAENGGDVEPMGVPDGPIYSYSYGGGGGGGSSSRGGGGGHRRSCGEGDGLVEGAEVLILKEGPHESRAASCGRCTTATSKC